MLRTVLMTAVLPFTFSTHAACVTDTSEIGDTGPASRLVCQMLEKQFPNATALTSSCPSASTMSSMVGGSVSGTTL